jgi:DNA polymerase
MNKLYIDIETYSSVDICESGAYKYIESGDFEVLLIGYAFNDGPVKVLDLCQGETMPEDLELALLSPEYIKVAHNAVFERLSFRRLGYTIPIEQWYCTLVKSAYCGLPLSLDQVSKVLNLENKKLDTGKALIKYFSSPCKPTRVNGMRTRNYPEHAPEKWELYKEYNKYDVLAEREIFKRLEAYDMPKAEWTLYKVDQEINDRGIMVDLELANSAVVVNNTYSNKLIEEVKALTGIANPNSTVQIKNWIQKQTGLVVDSLNKAAIQKVYATFEKYPKVIRLLDLRARLAKTSIKKYYAMLNCAMKDNRVRGTFQFYGANRTGRWAGRLIQLQNLSKNHTPAIEMPREIIRARDIDTVELLYDDVADILSQLVRTAFIAQKGKLFAVADFSAIEARVISWLSGEEWRMDVFRGDGKIYEATGSKMFNVPVSAITKGSELRQKSKISELALGYGGSIGALQRMGGERMGLSNTEMISLVHKWRNSNPKIVEYWHKLEAAAKEAIKYKKRVMANNKIAFDADANYLMMVLPSGRKLFYRNPIIKKAPDKTSPSIFYEGLIQTTKQWGIIDTYGGSLAENSCQAVARDLLGVAMINLAKAGYNIVAHVHDEVIVEVPQENAQQHYENIIKLMTQTPDWALDLPLKADGYITPFYQK